MNFTKPILNKNGTFDNPWQTKNPSVLEILKCRFIEKDHTGLPNDPKILNETLPVQIITENDLDSFYADASNQIRLLWLGHATCLINIENCIVLTDPVLRDKCGPKGFGKKRFRPLPLTIERIRKVDVVVISHNHYDHLDYYSVLEINEKFGNKVEWFVSKGIKKWFDSIGIKENVIELSWWESSEYKNMKFVFTIAQHWSGRGIIDRHKTLWGSWIIIGPNKRFLFVGDTGYCSAFTEIGEHYGPFDLCAIPIGHYAPKYVMSSNHVDPEEAVRIHIDVKSRMSIGIHWGTFRFMGTSYYLEPIEKLTEAKIKYELDSKCFLTINHGAVYETERS